MEKSRSVSTILVFLGLDPAPPSFRHARPRVRRPSGLDSSVLGPVSNSVVRYLTYFGQALGRRKGGTFPLVVYENKRAEIDGILVGKGNIFLSGSTSAALGKYKKPHRLMVKIKEETYATEQGVRNGKNKRGNLCNTTRRWKSNWWG